MATGLQNVQFWSPSVPTGLRPTSAPNGGTARGYQAVFASLAIAVPGPDGPTGSRPGALPIRLMVAALA